MKKVFALAFVALSLMTSCSSDDSVSVTEEKIAKRWYIKSYVSEGQTVVYQHQSCEKDYVHFFNDGTSEQQEIYDCAPFDVDVYYSNWAFEGKNISFDFFESPYNGKITKLDNNNLQITVVDDFDEDGNAEDIKINFTSN